MENLDYIDPTTEKYKKRFPSNYEKETSKHFLNDKDIDVQLYSYLQSLSYAVDIKDEKGKVIDHETRVNEKDVPSYRKLAKIIGCSRDNVSKKFHYLLSATEDNIYCPYMELSEDGTYYTLLNKETYYAYISQPMVQYLTKGFSQNAIRTYIFLLAVYNCQVERKKEKLKKLTGEAKEKLAKEPVHVIFCLSEVAENIGYKIDKNNIKNYGYLWRADEERAKVDPNYRLGEIPVALIALRNGKLIEWETVTNKKTGHKMYKMTKINTDIKAVLSNEKPKEMTPQDEETRKISKEIIEEKSYLRETPKTVDPNYKKSKMSDECKKHLNQTFHF